MLTARIDTQLRATGWNGPSHGGLEVEKDDSYVEIVGVKGKEVQHLKNPVAIRIGYDRHVIVEAQDLDIALQAAGKSTDDSKVSLHLVKPEGKSASDPDAEEKDIMVQDSSDTPCSE